MKPPLMKDVIDIAVHSFVMVAAIVGFVFIAVGITALVHGIIVVLN